MLKNGLYEQVISNAIDRELVGRENETHSQPINEAEAGKILSRYASEIIEKGLDYLHDRGETLDSQVSLINRIIRTVSEETGNEDTEGSGIAERKEQLLALFRRKDDISAVNEKQYPIRPESSLSRSSLFTGAVREPQMGNELKKEILSCSRIDMLVSFIRFSGLRMILEELEQFTENGGELRIITTCYMGATELKAIEELRKLPNTRIKVSYDTNRTRLHAKAYIFYRDTGFTTAYVGSSNLSRAAMTDGLEWNTKITRQDLPETIDKISATFEYYWNDKEFEYYEEDQQERLARALKAEKYSGSESSPVYFMDVRPYAYQQEVLDKLEAERTVRGFNRNLVVAATGTGKTVISALDYRRFVKQQPGQKCRLLFIAHREEILKQSLSTFRTVLKDVNFGEMFVGGYRPEESLDYLFMSIQTFNSQDFTSKTSPEFFDYIVVDEFHHAAAPTYQKLLSYYKPKILLGLTATPERMDGKNILSWFSNRIAAEIRLPEAIDRGLLCPFQYFGVSDEIDLSKLKWARGGYDKTELSNLYTMSGIASARRADLVLFSLNKYSSDINEVKGLGFCVSIAHARFMSEYFNTHGIPSLCLSGESPEEERSNAKRKLVTGEIHFIFVVDLYNEGVDIPEINTVLFLRPTESLTIFLQQLGRGLRLSEGKECLTVLDFIGQAHKKYNYEEKFSALLAGTEKNTEREIKNGFVSVPKGCYIHLERLAQKYVLDNIRAGYGFRAGLISRIASFTEDTGLELNLSNFLNHYHLDARSIYKLSTFSRLCTIAGVQPEFSESIEETLQKAMAKLCVIDSRRWIDFLLELLPKLADTNFMALSDIEKRMLQMFYVTVWNKTADSFDSDETLDNLFSLAESPVLLAELQELLNYQRSRIDFVDAPMDLGFDCPLDLYCTYSRDQLLTAMDFMKPNTVREGVKWLPEKKIDVLMNTLNKSDKDYSPTTMYNDYSISEELFHWQSQSTTSADSATGRRYQNHKEMGSQVLLFVREYKTDRITGGAEAYTCLGPAEYVKHEGEKPMNITWHMLNPIPAKYLKKTNKLAIG